MNIQTNFDSIQSLTREAPVARTGGAKGSPAGAVQPFQAAPAFDGDGDTTRISDAAVSAAAASGASDVRAEKVAAIQQALASGSYAVSPADVAGKLIDHLLQK